jgi:hypothetical protein
LAHRRGDQHPLVPRTSVRRDAGLKMLCIMLLENWGVPFGTDKISRIKRLRVTACMGDFSGEWWDVKRPLEIGVAGETFKMKKGDSVILKPLLEPPMIMLQLKEPERDVELPLTALTKITTASNSVYF